jgi:hypothetical protein
VIFEDPADAGLDDVALKDHKAIAAHLDRILGDRYAADDEEEDPVAADHICRHCFLFVQEVDPSGTCWSCGGPVGGPFV